MNNAQLDALTLELDARGRGPKFAFTLFRDIELGPQKVWCLELSREGMKTHPKTWERSLATWLTYRRGPEHTSQRCIIFRLTVLSACEATERS